MNTKSIEGPVAVFEFVGDVKLKAIKLKYVAAAWLDGRGTRVAVKLLRKEAKPYAEKMLAEALGQPSVWSAYSSSGCDVFVVPNIQN